MNLITIETGRLILTGISNEDMKYIFENLSKPEIKKIFGHRSEEEFRIEKTKHKNGYSSYNRSFLLFLLTDKTSGKIIGRCGLHNWNKEHKRAEIGYVMEDEHYKGKGLMAEAVNAIMDYGFNELNLNRIEALVGIKNAPSLRLMEKFNFKREGVLRQHCFIADQFEDSVLFSRLYGEYIEEKAKTERTNK
jgi:[ribosomal protein S5]-alanine N-acetyltransferase